VTVSNSIRAVPTLAEDVGWDTPPIVQATATRLRGAAAGWADLTPADRVEVLRRFADQIRLRRADFLSALSADTGRNQLSAMEVDAVLSQIDRCSGWALDAADRGAQSSTVDPGVVLRYRPVPLGLVGVVAPWNFPLQLAMIDAIPALLAGCAVLIKPSELAPHIVPVLRETVRAVPELAAVTDILLGGPDVGKAVVDAVDAVCFTGSVSTGRIVGEHAARRFIPAFLELGGKDPAIVCPGADLEIAAAGVLWGATANTGQSCMSIERVYVHQDVAEAFVNRLVAGAAALSVGGPGVDGDLGPFIDPAQAEVVAAHLTDAVDRGAVVHCGGQVTDDGSHCYLAPTVLTGVDHAMLVMTEETFGPVIPVMTVTNMDEAVRLANDSTYGLSAAVFGSTDEALEVAVRLRAGGVSINDVCLTGLAPDCEKQAFGMSGLGPSRMGPVSLTRFVRQRVLLERQDPRVQPWWYRGGAVPTSTVSGKEPTATHE
jgi:acyl-CoA reductase-like NAD-dependent aldehyde dehydrogenase